MATLVAHRFFRCLGATVDCLRLDLIGAAIFIHVTTTRIEARNAACLETA